MLVTDASHLPRAARCFRAQGINVVPAGSRFRTNRFQWSLSSFLPSAGGAQGFGRAMHEWLGSLWYELTGKT